MIKILGICLLVFFLTMFPVNAENLHGGEICLGCHQKLADTFGIDGGIQVVNINSKCGKCHAYVRTKNPDARMKGQQLHMTICKGCHPPVHILHKEKKIGCRVCHQSPRGWNSSIVTIPVPEKEDMMVFDGVEIAIPKSSDCGYCHISGRNARRVHDYHESKMGEICEECHPNVMESKQAKTGHELVRRYLMEEEEEKNNPPFLILEFSRYFIEISKNLEALFLSVR